MTLILVLMTKRVSSTRGGDRRKRTDAIHALPLPLLKKSGSMGHRIDVGILGDRDPPTERMTKPDPPQNVGGGPYLLTESPDRTTAMMRATTNIIGKRNDPVMNWTMEGTEKDQNTKRKQNTNGTIVLYLWVRTRDKEETTDKHKVTVF